MPTKQQHLHIRLLAIITAGIMLLSDTTHAACANPSAEAGEIVYNTDYNVLQYCDGTNWKAAGVCSTPDGIPSGVGFFVLTESKYDGNLGDIAGADALCLTEMQNKNWKGKSVATVNSTTVKAFLCDHGSCNLGTPNATYYYAIAGDTSTGGASFTTNASGYGIVGSDSWATPQHFGGYYSYWVGGRDRVAQPGTQWEDDNYSSNIECSQQWDSASNTNVGGIGTSGSHDNKRWLATNAPCNIPQRLICFVHP